MLPWDSIEPVNTHRVLGQSVSPLWCAGREKSQVRDIYQVSMWKKKRKVCHKRKPGKREREKNAQLKTRIPLRR